MWQIILIHSCKKEIANIFQEFVLEKCLLELFSLLVMSFNCSLIKNLIHSVRVDQTLLNPLSHNKFAFQYHPQEVFPWGIEVHQGRTYNGCRRLGGPWAEPSGRRRVLADFQRKSIKLTIFRQKFSNF